MAGITDLVTSFCGSPSSQCKEEIYTFWVSTRVRDTDRFSAWKISVHEAEKTQTWEQCLPEWYFPNKI